MVGRRIFLVSALAITSLVLRTSVASAALTATVGANVNITKTAGNQTEGTIAVNPANASQLFFASNPGSFARRSTDAGATWVAAGTGIGASCCDNVAAWDAFGNLFLVNINGALNAVVLYLSTDGGANFTLLQTIDTGRIDQPSVKAGAGSVWVTWNDGEIKARGAAVTGLGTVGAFTGEQAAGAGQFGDIEIGPTGQVVVTYQSSTACPCTIFAATDTNGLTAGGFSPQVTVSTTNVNTFDFIPAQDARSIDAEANLAWDRSGGSFNGRLYIAYTDEAPDESNDTDNFVRFSTDNGATWSAPVRVNDDATTRSQFLPNISLDQTTGNVAVTWHDARNDAANNNTQFWGAVSDTGGASFGANFQISAGTSNDDTAASGIDYGDYTTSTFNAGLLYPTWSDNSNSTADNPAGGNSTFDMYTAKITVASVVVNTPPVLTVPGAQSVDFNDPLTFGVSATDANAGDTLSFSATGLPAGLTLTDNGNRTATVSGTISASPAVFTATISVNDGHNPAVTATVQITVTKEETAIAQTGTFTQDYNDPYVASATLTDPDGGAPIAGKSIVFTLGVGDTCTASTDALGVASCSITPTQAAATVALIASFGGDTNYASTSNSKPFVITKEETTTKYTGPLVIANGLPVTLTGKLLEDGVTPISGRTLTLSVGSQPCTGTTNATGDASCSIPAVSVPLGSVTVKADFAGDAFYLPSSESKTAIVFAFPASGDFVLGDATAAAAGPTTTVTFWGAEWSSLNTLSVGVVEPSFKGFAATPSSGPPACGGTWLTAPGNSSSPVATVPTYMGVAVASVVAKSGSRVSGNIVQIVVVKTDPGYAPNPGHPGTGTIVATYC